MFESHVAIFIATFAVRLVVPATVHERCSDAGMVNADGSDRLKSLSMT